MTIDFLELEDSIQEEKGLAELFKCLPSFLLGRKGSYSGFKFRP